MADISQSDIEQIVSQVLSRLGNSPQQRADVHETGGGAGVFDRIDDAINATTKAQREWARTSRAQREKVISALREVMHQHADEFARMSRDETGMGRVEDKIEKHHNAADASPGLEDLESSSWTGDKGLVVEEYGPYGLIAGITPSTHPIPVLFNSTVIMIAPGNGVVFNVHPAAKKVSAYAMEIFNRTIQENGGPANLISMVREPTMETVDTLFHHPDVALIAATGGPALVKAAFQAGKKIVAAGPGNPPVLVDDSACLKSAVTHIIQGASFDNNILCIAEKEVFVVRSVYQDFMHEMESQGAVKINSQQIERLTGKVFSENEKGQPVIGREFIGKNASVLGRAVGMEIGDEVRLLFGETSVNHLFVQEEQMMPFLPIVPVDDVTQGIEYSVQAEHGFRHTAMIHSNNLQTITDFNRVIDTDIVVVNGPSLAGNGGHAGEAYFSHTIASPTGEGIATPRDFARIRRMATYNSLQIV